MEFPRLVYRCPGPFSHTGGTHANKAVNNVAEFDAALADGWFDNLPAAIEGKSPSPVAPVTAFEPKAAPTRAELEAQAAELGIKVHGNTSDKKLAEAIAAKLGA